MPCGMPSEHGGRVENQDQQSDRSNAMTDGGRGISITVITVLLALLTVTAPVAPVAAAAGPSTGSQPLVSDSQPGQSTLGPASETSMSSSGGPPRHG